MAFEDGGTVNVADGIYDENVTVDRTLVLSGSGSSSTSLIAPVGGVDVVSINAADVTMQDFRIDASNVSGHGVLADEADDLLLKNLNVLSTTNIPQKLVEVIDSTNATVEDVVLTGPGSSTSFGVTQGFRGENLTNLTLTNLTVSEMPDHAIDIFESVGVMVDVANITGEDFSDFSSWGGVPGPEAIRIEDSSSVTVKNSAIDGGFIGINFAYAAGTGSDTGTQGVIDNNTIGHTWDAILVADNSDAVILHNNLGTSNTGILVGFLDVDAIPVTAEITDNVITNTVRGIRVLLDQAAGAFAHNNKIFDNS